MQIFGKSILIVDQQRTLASALHIELDKLGIRSTSLFKFYPQPYSYTNPLDKIKNLFQRNFLNNKEYYQFLIQRHFDRYCFNALNKIKGQHFDYILVIRADKFSPHFLQKLSTLTENMVAYQWDGIRVEKLAPVQKYFKSVFVYDPTDINKLPGLKLTTNYHFNDFDPYKKITNDLLYVGAIYPGENREEKIHQLLSTGLFSKVEVIFKGFGENFSRYTYLHDDLPYYEYLEKVKYSGVIADLKPSYQNGLSFRFFEALIHRKKLITDNYLVLNYDFYHPNNIFLTDFIKLDGLEEFLKLPLYEHPKELIHKYSLEAWLSTILA